MVSPSTLLFLPLPAVLALGVLVAAKGNVIRRSRCPPWTSVTYESLSFSGAPSSITIGDDRKGGRDGVGEEEERTGESNLSQMPISG